MGEASDCDGVEFRMSNDALPQYEWHVAKVKESVLEETLNRLQQEWEIYLVMPTIHFGRYFMGAPVPSEVMYTVIARRERDS